MRAYFSCITTRIMRFFKIFYLRSSDKVIDETSDEVFAVVR